MRVRRTFAFVDLCGFTAFTASRGDRAAAAVLAHLRATLRAAAERRGVRITKWLGDGAMLCGLDVEALVLSVLSVRDTVALEAPLALRGGIAEGRAIVLEGDDYVGAVVNVAAQLATRAGPNQVLATADVAEQLGGLVTLRPCRDVRVAGVAAPIEIRELLAPPVDGAVLAGRSRAQRARARDRIAERG